MPPPYDEMAKRKKWEAKELAVKNISTSLDMRGRKDFDYKIRIVASEIEKAQNWL
jgi:hypothetical protein